MAAEFALWLIERKSSTFGWMLEQVIKNLFFTYQSVKLFDVNLYLKFVRLSKLTTWKP